MLTTLPHITKYLWTLSALLLWFTDPDPEREATVRVAPDSVVVISGTTNVNQFTCKYNLQELELPIRLTYDEKAQHILFKNAKLKLANDCFDCGGKAINKDFRELLQTKSHPEVELKLLYVNPPQPEKETISVGMEIKIAGVTRKYESILNCEQKGGICVKGTLALKLTDFGLEPPKKVLGMIKVDNEIQVHMTLQMKEI